MPYLLKNLEIDEISFVDAGANQHAKVVLYKRATTIHPPAIGRIVDLAAKALGSSRVRKQTEAVSFDQAMAASYLSDWYGDFGDMVSAFWQSLCSIVEAGGDLPTAQASIQQFATALDTEITALVGAGDVTKAGRKISAARLKALGDLRDTLAQLIAEATTASGAKETDMAKADITKLSKAAQDVLAATGVTELTTEQAVTLEAALPKAPAPETKPEDVLKSAPPELRALVEKAQADVKVAQAKAEQAETIAKAERDQRVTREYIAKARSLDALPGMNADDFGGVLKGLAEKAPEEWTKLEPMLKSWHESIKTGALFVEKGRGGEGGGSAEAAITAKAAELVSKSDKKLTLDAARLEFLKTAEGQALYAKYLDENPAQTGRR